MDGEKNKVDNEEKVEEVEIAAETTRQGSASSSAAKEQQQQIQHDVAVIVEEDRDPDAIQEADVAANAAAPTRNNAVMEEEHEHEQEDDDDDEEMYPGAYRIIGRDGTTEDDHDNIAGPSDDYVDGDLEANNSHPASGTHTTNTTEEIFDATLVNDDEDYVNDGVNVDGMVAAVVTPMMPHSTAVLELEARPAPTTTTPTNNKKDEATILQSKRRIVGYCCIFLYLLVGFVVLMIVTLTATTNPTSNSSENASGEEIDPDLLNRPTSYPTISPTASPTSVLNNENIDYVWNPLVFHYGEEQSNRYGHAVKLSSNGDILAVGQPGYKQNTGSVVIHYLNEENDQEEQNRRIDIIEGFGIGDEFGTSVAMNLDGTVIAGGTTKGAANSTLTGGGNGDLDVFGDGYVRIATWNESLSNWTFTLLQGGSSDTDTGFFGRSIGLSGDGTILVVGSCNFIVDYENHFYDTSSYSHGQVQVYQLKNNYSTTTSESDGEWQQIGTTILGEDPGEECGNVVAISDDGLVIATACPRFRNNTGRVRVFRYQPSNSSITTNSTDDWDWVKVGNDLVGNGTENYFGGSMDMTGDGAYVTVAAASGYVRTFYYDYSKDKDDDESINDWVVLTQDIVTPLPDAIFRGSVSIANKENGGLVLVASLYFHLVPDVIGGFANIMLYRGEGDEWEDVGQDLIEETGGERYGLCTALSGTGTTVAVGADGANDDKGRVEVYKVFKKEEEDGDEGEN